MKIDANIPILIVDDSSEARAMVKSLLNKKGFKNLVLAENGENALQILEETTNSNTPIGIILADWKMPSMSGYDLYKKIKEVKEYRKIPFIMITAYADIDLVKRAIAIGISDYLVKPFTAQKLFEKIGKVFRQKAA